MSKHIIAIEGGGTNCRAILGTDNGDILDRFTIQEPANINYGDGLEAIQTIISALKSITHANGLTLNETHIGLCLPGISNEENLERLYNTFTSQNLPKPCVQSDATAALLAIDSENPDKCTIAINGTGSIVMGLNNAEIYRTLGTGFPNDICSGASIGFDALKHYAQTNGQEAPNSLAAEFKKFASNHGLNFQSSDDEHYIEVLPNYYAELFPFILKHFKDNETDGKNDAYADIVYQHINAMADIINQFTKAANMRKIGFVGGVSDHLKPYIIKRLNNGIKVEEGPLDHLEGALTFARETYKDGNFLSLGTTKTHRLNFEV